MTRIDTGQQASLGPGVPPESGTLQEPGASRASTSPLPAPRGMRAASVANEAWRNVRTGTTRALLLACVLIVALGSLAVVDMRAVVAVAQGAADFRAAGASTQVFTLAGGVDAQRCTALADVDGITAVGALRAAPAVRLHNLPSTDVPLFEVTPGFLSVLGQMPGPGPGIALSQSLATAIDAVPGSAIATTTGPSVVGSVYPFPEDGRNAVLTYAALAPVPATGLFDACWAEVWPANERTSSLLLLTASPNASTDAAAQATLAQLNSRLGQTYDPASLLRERPTRFAGYAAVAAGFALGVVAIRARRLELAAALHSRVSRTAMTWQTLLETATWAGAAVVILTPVLALVAAYNNPEPPGDYWAIALRIVAAGASAALLGAAAAAAATREKHLFRYFKER